MNSDELAAALQRRGVTAPRQSDLWTAFCSEMAQRTYGDEATLDAWVWFKSGWSARDFW